MRLPDEREAAIVREGDAVVWGGVCHATAKHVRSFFFFFFKCGKCKSSALNTHMNEVVNVN